MIDPIKSSTIGFQGPSPKYYEAQERFDNILEEKLHIKSENSINKNLDNQEVLNTLFEDENFSSSNNLISSDKYSDLNSRITKIAKQVNNPYSSAVSDIIKPGLVDTRDLRKKTSYSAEYLDSILSGSPLEGMGKYFKKAEEEYGVNAVVLMAIAKLESDFGRSKIARDKNNLFGFSAFDSSPYASARKYNTKQDSIFDVARHLAVNYLSPQGQYFNGYSVSSVGKKYCTSKDWPTQVKKIADQFTKR